MESGLQRTDRRPRRARIPGAPSETTESKVFNPADDWRASHRSVTGDTTTDAAGNQYAYASKRLAGRRSDEVAKFKATLLLSYFSPSTEPRRLDDAEGFFDIAGFTRSGAWLLYWKVDEMSADIQTDGLELHAANTANTQLRKLGVETLVHDDMLSISPTRDVIAVSAGGGRETWANKVITLLDLTAHGNPAISTLTNPARSAQLPAWSPDGKMLAWCAGPDAEALYKQQLLARGQKTIKAVDPRTGAPKQIPITPNLDLGAPPDLIEQCVRQRRIWLAEIDGPCGHSKQLTHDAHYSDEEPLWSHDGSHILFCRIDSHAARTIWVMRNDGSHVRQVAGPLAPPPDLSEGGQLSYCAYYGYTDWRTLFDWRRG